jgi:transcriptional regulator with XRE-family HTH domain
LRAFASRLHLSAAFVSDVELGRRHPSKAVLADMAEVLGVSIKDLRARDTRVPIEDLKRIAESDPAFTIALRTIIDRKITGDEILTMLGEKKNRKFRN